jgi:hypothetical protein
MILRQRLSLSFLGICGSSQRDFRCAVSAQMIDPLTQPFCWYPDSLHDIQIRPWGNRLECIEGCVEVRKVIAEVDVKPLTPTTFQPGRQPVVCSA